MAISIEEAAALLNIEKERLMKDGLKAFVAEKLRQVRVETLTLYREYHISSLSELDQKINRGELSESDTLEDFARLDFLESEEQKLAELITKL